MAMETSLEAPAPVRSIANALSGWINRLGWVWVEGQIAQLTRRPGTQTVFLTLRDTAAEVSITVTCPRRVFDAVEPPVTEGARVVVHAKPTYYVPRGTLNLSADDIRPVGLGELLARLEQRRRLLAAEGLFARELKRRLPFLPHVVGVVCGRNSAAERDVLDNGRRRWPGVRFRVENTAVQGHDAARQVIEAVGQLDRDPQVEVIVIARGGGSVEDLLPFSDEGLVRAVAACRTPVVSAIGHEQDSPLLDLVADARASTPTDAAKHVVPDVREEQARVLQARDRGRQLMRAWLDRETHALDVMRSRPALAAPFTAIDDRERGLHDFVGRGRRCLGHHLDRAGDDLAHQLARVRALSPLATLERGYAVLQGADGMAVRDATDVRAGDSLTAQLARGRIGVSVDTIEADDTLAPDTLASDDASPEQPDLS
ncbi:MAG TPA: exodeoxyribonuclease VII large subunit [Nocardioidaceae bacterium]|nr:exodeoxyribonuclease VII large subunit [Nocardioidaceae bacterium]